MLCYNRKYFLFTSYLEGTTENRANFGKFLVNQLKYEPGGTNPVQSST